MLLEQQQQQQQRLFINISNGKNSLLTPIVDHLYYLNQVVAGFYSLLLVVIFISILSWIISSVKQKRKLEAINSTDNTEDTWNSIGVYRERILSFSIALVLLVFEMGFSFTFNVIGFIYIAFSGQTKELNVNISNNCELTANTYLAEIYGSNSVDYVMLPIMGGCGRFCFLLTIWLFSVSLVHLNYAACELYKPKVCLYWILFGVSVGIVMFILMLLKWSNLFAVFFLTTLTQGSMFCVIYNYGKFSTSMKMRINAAYHSRNKEYLNEQKKLFKKYSNLIPLLSCIFEIFIFKDLIVYNCYLLLETFALNSCWFRVTFGITSIINLSVPTIRIMAEIAFYCLVIVRILDFLFFTLNCIVLCCFLLKSYIGLRKKYSKALRYRYNSEYLKNPLISNASTDHTQ